MSWLRDFQKAHGRPPTAIESVALAQQANLETREAKHEPRSFADQRRTWLDEAAQVLGSEKAIGSMVATTLDPGRPDHATITAAWIREVAERVISELEAHQATWRTQHVLAEVQRQLRGVALPIDRATQVAQLVADEVVARSVNLTPDTDPIADPKALRRSDGTSVYRHTGTDHYTSQRLLDAEQRIVATAGHANGFARTAEEVEWSVLVARLHDVPLNRGQEALVTAMATSGARVQLALAPAGSGKTTAMQVLAAAWTAGGCNAIGLAPSAAAAAALAEATEMPCETLAKLDHDLIHSPGSALVASIRPGTLVVIDEAGMADTLTLDRVIAYAASRNAVVRLIGDDQQLAAIGAGGVLRDIATTHGALRLDELVRFADPAEATASLDLRDGDPAALGFYLDHERVYVGDVDGCADEVFEAWVRERAGGRDCLMLAPTRDLVRELNVRAQAFRDLHGPSVRLSDDCEARAGDMVITRRNDRRLGISGSDWVKNGDRWIVASVDDGALAVRHRESGLRTTLPAAYVAEHVELGYASTVHTAQGLTADVVHGIVTGQESRQTLYTMLTRGRAENHVHVVLAEAEDHVIPAATLDRASTATELLEGIVARDGAAVSATTTRSVAASPESQLRDAVSRYADALTLAASKLHLDLEEEPAGPLPWLAGVPADLAEHPAWGPYLTGRVRRVSSLAAEVGARSGATLPEWMRRYDDVLTPELRADLAVWRAARGVRANDRTMAGPIPNNDDEAGYYRHLTRTINARYGEAIKLWEERVVEHVGKRDEQTVNLAKQLDKLQRRGVDAGQVLDLAVRHKPLPVDRATAALAYRVRGIATAQQRRQAPVVDPFDRRSPQRPGPALGM